MIITLPSIYIIILGFDNLDFVSRSQVCQKYKLQIACFGFLSSVVHMLYYCCIHSKDHAQYDLCDSGVNSREIINMFIVDQLGLSKTLALGFTQTTKM